MQCAMQCKSLLCLGGYTFHLCHKILLFWPLSKIEFTHPKEVEFTCFHCLSFSCVMSLDLRIQWVNLVILMCSLKRCWGSNSDTIPISTLDCWFIIPLIKCSFDKYNPDMIQEHCDSHPTLALHLPPKLIYLYTKWMWTEFIVSTINKDCDLI